MHHSVSPTWLFKRLGVTAHSAAAMYATAVMSAARCGHLAYELPLSAAIAGPSIGRRGSFCAEWDGVSAQRLTACTRPAAVLRAIRGRLDSRLFMYIYLTLLLQCWLRAYRTNDNTYQSNSTLGSCFSLCVKLTTVVGACLRLEMSANIRARTCNGVRFDDTTLSTDTPVLCLPSRITFITYQQDCTLQIQEGERSVVFPLRRIREDSRFEPSCSQAFPILIR